MRLRRFMTSTLATMAVAIGALSPIDLGPIKLGSVAHAQQAPSNVAVVSIAPLDRLLKDTSYLLRACNVPEMGGLVSIMANQYTQGLDRTKPIGAMISLESQTPTAVLFMPMTDRELFFGALAGMGVEPDDLGDGLFEIAMSGQTIFAKEANGWMYIAQSEDGFGQIPEDPSKMLGRLPATYDIAVRFNVKELPQDMKDMIVEQVRVGFERGMAEQGGQTEEQRAAAEEMGNASIAQIEQLMSDTEQVFVGWSVDQEAQLTFFDGGAQFIEGSKLAEQSKLAAEMTSDYTNFKLPGSSANFRFSSLIAESDRGVAKNNLRNSMSQAETQLEQNGELPEEAKEIVRDLLAGLEKVLVATIDEGVFDGASSVSVADDTLRVLIGGRIADGEALAAEFKKAVAKLPDDPNVPKFEFDYETYKGTTLHRVTAEVKSGDPAVQRVFGDMLTITIGTAPKGFLISLDPTGDASAKAAIDAMSASMGVKATPFEGLIEFENILRFAQAVSPNSILDNAVSTVAEYAGKDKIQVNGRLIERGAVYRASIDEGVLRAIGAAAKSGGGGGF